MKTALITGIRGQDGAYLARLLLEKGYRVIGTDRRSGSSSYWRLDRLGITSQIEYVYMDLLEPHNVDAVIKKYQPDELYNLAAQSFVQSSFDQPFVTSEVNAMGVLRLLEAIRTYSPHTRFYQASTSELYGQVVETPQRETTPFYPRSPYGVAKAFAHYMTVNYRESYNLFACCGILFNHESPLRGSEFVTRKITQHVAAVSRLVKTPDTDTYPVLYLGNMDAKRDWSHAEDMVRGMWLMLQQDSPDDYVLASGETNTVKTFVEMAFALSGIEVTWEGSDRETRGIWKDKGVILVETDERFYRPADVELLLGDPTKARDQLGWTPKYDLVRLVTDMMRNE